MSGPDFQVTEHVMPCQYIREYPHALKSECRALQLAIKEYQPIDDLMLSADSVTIIAAHGNGFPKECYEPLFSDLLRAAKGRIRSIWIADSSHQGASGVLNEDIQGDDPDWFDHSRDLLCMVNRFQSRMPRPIVGIAHSMGCAQLIHLSLLHPRLFHGLALIEPIIQVEPPEGPHAALPSSYRPDFWPSRSAAEASFRKSKFFTAWDSRALSKYLSYGLRETPTALYPAEGKTQKSEAQSPNQPVTLTTTKHQEAWSYTRSNFVPLRDHGQARMVAPNLSAEDASYLSHCPNTVMTYNNLPHVRSNVLWIFGAASNINGVRASQDEKVARTGTGVGGSGGEKVGRVKTATLNAGHMLPFEKVDECALALAAWLKDQCRDYADTETFWREFNSRRSERGMTVLSKTWFKAVRGDPREKRAEKANL